MGMKPTGYLLYEDSERIAVLTLKSQNTKTGEMAQLWILARSENPLEAIKSGADSAVCGNCPHRGSSCYVRVEHAPLAVWRAYHRGSYPVLTDYSLLRSLKVRLGAYGDPAFLPVSLLEQITANCAGWTGYTHQWRSVSSDYARFVMASADSVQDANEAQSLGYRTFRVSSSVNPRLGEISCPASDEAGKRTTCAKCKLCNGVRPNGDYRKNITIKVHGAKASKFINIEGVN